MTAADAVVTAADDRHLVGLTVNGRERTVSCPARANLADVLRHDLLLTGTHVGCEHGICGACTVLVDDRPVRACLMLAVQAEGSQVRTVESLSPDGRLNDLQAAFMRHHALQCGFCTPGFLMLAEAFLARCPRPSRDDIRDAVAANLCRCTGYQTIVDAIADCAERRATGDDGASSEHGVATADREGLSSDVRRRGAGEQQDRPDDVLGGS